ncbi:OmpA family protein [Novosphingobium sp.]|uniref:OmpA family protein n=1 Tax=Novosphingobium sp. TaxID=1874826 RepID=UPI003BAA25C4
MRAPTSAKTGLMLAAALVASLPAGSLALAQELPPVDQNQAQPTQQPAANSEIHTTVAPTGDTATLPKGPDIKGVISRRSADRMEITADDGTKTIVNVNDYTKIRSSKGLFGMSRQQLAANALLNGLPVTVHTLQSGDALMAADIQFKDKDLKIANMIRTGTKQGFEEQTAATAEVRTMTEALRSRFGDIDDYNIKATTNVNFASGKTQLTPQGKADLCATATQAQSIKNAVLLVVGYADSRGNEDLNQRLSDQRATRVVNYLQQTCGWKPYRMLTPSGMATANPLADNSTPEGRAQNRRVAVNVMVSKAVDGL